MATGSFIISLDFELHWGVRDVVDVRSKRDHFLRAREAIPETLRLFREYEVHATWATVGFLFARNKRHLLEHAPSVRPRYDEARFDPYANLDQIGNDEKDDPFHYAGSLLRLVAETPGQEIGTHTFSHYYCLEQGQTRDAFEHDLRAAASIGEPFGNVTRSLVFPRGQHNPAYDDVLPHAGVETYRVPPTFFAYRPRRADQERLSQRAFRLVDSYVPIGGMHAHVPEAAATPAPQRAGLFLRPYSPARRRLEPVRMARMKQAMASAAKGDRDFHLWWHPHNFGTNTRENLRMLTEILEAYRSLRDRHGWASRTMSEASASARGAA
ncbi:MAG: polysaccharide deacetylase family protein [Myxococcota bacterium]